MHFFLKYLKLTKKTEFNSSNKKSNIFNFKKQMSCLFFYFLVNFFNLFYCYSTILIVRKLQKKLIKIQLITIIVIRIDKNNHSFIHSYF